MGHCPQNVVKKMAGLRRLCLRQEYSPPQLVFPFQKCVTSLSGNIESVMIGGGSKTRARILENHLLGVAPCCSPLQTYLLPLHPAVVMGWRGKQTDEKLSAFVSWRGERAFPKVS